MTPRAYVAALLAVGLLILFLQYDIKTTVENGIRSEDPAMQEFVEITHDGNRERIFVDPSMDIADILRKVQQGLAVGGQTCSTCWQSNVPEPGTEYTVFTAQQPGETLAQKQTRHADRVSALQAVYPKTGECGG